MLCGGPSQSFEKNKRFANTAIELSLKRKKTIRYSFCSVLFYSNK